DLGIHPAKTVADMVDQVAEHLASNELPLIIDEADNLVSRRLIEVVRDIYESSGAAIILVGEERLPQNLQQWERVHGRVLDWVAAQPASAADVAKLVDLHSPDVPFDADFQAAILTACNGSTRRVCINLETMRMVALENGWDRLSVARWGKRAFFNGAAPAPRRMVNP
ncbi:MAG: AAA family ATPase, partial [Pseudomonadota bacterium]